jgi:hypothetical protein
MRAKEFVTEQRMKLSQDIADPIRHAFILPGIRNNDAYRALRFSIALARARAEVAGYAKDWDTFEEESAFGQNAIVLGFNDSVDEIIDKALEMTKTPGGKELIGSKNSMEPPEVQKTSPVKAFKGYPR